MGYFEGGICEGGLGTLCMRMILRQAVFLLFKIEIFGKDLDMGVKIAVYIVLCAGPAVLFGAYTYLIIF